MPGQRGLLEQPYGERAAPALVAGPAAVAQERAGESVGLLGTYAGDPQQLPGVAPQLVIRCFAERRCGLSGQRRRGAALGQYGTDRLDGLGGGLRGPAAGGVCWVTGAGRGAGAARRGSGAGSLNTRAVGFSPLSTARTAASRSAAVPLSLVPLAMGPSFSAFRCSIRSRSARCAANSASASEG